MLEGYSPEQALASFIAAATVVMHSRLRTITVSAVCTYEHVGKATRPHLADKCYQNQQCGCDSGTAAVTDSITGSTSSELQPPALLHHSHHYHIQQKLVCSIHRLQAVIEQCNEPHNSL